MLSMEVTFCKCFFVGCGGLRARVNQGWGPSPSGLSRYYQASSPGCSLGASHVLADCEGLLLLVKAEVLLLLLSREFEEPLGGLDEALVLVQCGVPSLRQQLLPLALAEVYGHLLSPESGIIYLGSQEDLCLGLLDDLHSQVACPLLALLSRLLLLLLFFGGLLRKRCSLSWLTLLFLLLRFLQGPVDVDHRCLLL